MDTCEPSSRCPAPAQELDSGAIVIDGVNIAKMGVEQLRANMAIIPQARSLADDLLGCRHEACMYLLGCKKCL